MRFSFMEMKNQSLIRVVAVGCMLMILFLSACAADEGNAPSSSREEPVGSSDGQAIFQERCAGCHTTTTEQKIGPGLAGLFSPGGPQLPNGADYGGKLPNGNDITEANVIAWIREGGRGQIGWMPGMPIDDQEMTELITYLQTLER